MDEQPKLSYTFLNWKRLRSLCRTMKKTEETVQTLKDQLNTKLSEGARSREKQTDVLSYRLSLIEIDKSIQLSKQNVRTVQILLSKNRKFSQDQAIDRRSFQDDIDLKKDEIVERQQSFVAIRERLVRTSAQLFHRRRQMLQELRTIYDIELDKMPKNPKPTCCCNQLDVINGAHLPNGEMLAGHSDTQLSAGLFHVAHLLCIISRLLDVPLRYPIVYNNNNNNNNSCPVILDIAWPKMSQTDDPCYPLFMKGQDRCSFEYGVFLLNKNVTQLLTDCAIKTKNLSKTLDNLDIFFDHVCGSKSLSFFPPKTRLSSQMTNDQSSTTSLENERELPQFTNRKVLQFI